MSGELSVWVNETASVAGNFSALTETGSQFPAHLVKAIRVLEFFNTFYIPVIVALGLLGNILSFLVFFCTHLKLRSSSYYLGCLALSDIGYLIMLLFVWLNRKGIEVMNRHGWCQVIVYLSSSFSCWSVWLTVSFTAERFVAVNYPLWRLQLGTTHRARLVVAFTALLSFALNSCLLIFAGLADEEGNQTPVCGLLRQYAKAMHYINIVDTILTLIIPVVLIIYMNFMIARALFLFYSHHRTQRSASVQGEGSSKQDQVSERDIVGEFLLRRQAPIFVNPRRPLPQATQVTIARMLLLVSTVFILLNLPSYVVRLQGFILELRGVPVAIEVYTLQGFFMLLYYTNFGINFVVYNISSRMFRRALRDYLVKVLQTTYTFLTAKKTGATNSDISNFG